VSAVQKKSRLSRTILKKIDISVLLLRHGQGSYHRLPFGPNG
jgi:hypothetical protein